MPFGGTHKCPNDMKVKRKDFLWIRTSFSFQCLFKNGRGFTLGAYDCQCKNSHQNITLIVDGKELEWNETYYQNNSSAPIINTCECNPQPCLLVYNRFLRMIIVLIQSIFIIFVIILAAIVFQRRHVKIIKHSMWILLELILFGAVLLYGSVKNFRFFLVGKMFLVFLLH